MRTVLALLALALLASPTLSSQTAPSAPVDPIQQFRSLAQQLPTEMPDECFGPVDPAADERLAYENEDKLFAAATDAVLRALRSHPENAAEAARDVLGKLRAISEEVDASWLEPLRFKFDVLDVSPALVIKMSIFNGATFSTFVNGPVTGAQVLGGLARDQTWHFEAMGTDDWGPHGPDLHIPFEKLELYGLPRGPSHNPRFLSVMDVNGCFAPGATFNTAYEWHRVGSSNNILWQRIKILDGQSTDAGSGKVLPWLRFQLVGNLLTIPYCWGGPDPLVFGSIWGVICSADTYDLSENMIRLRSHRTDRPDLEVISSVSAYAKTRDLRAIQPFCISPAVAANILQLMPSSFGASAGIQTHRIAPNREVIELSDHWDVKFTLERVQGRWLISAFNVSNN